MTETAPAPAPKPPARGPLISADDALARLLAAVAPSGRTETVATPEAWGRVLARDVVSPVHVPPEDNSAMDGYAVRIADLANGAGTLLPVSQRIVAGRPGQPLATGTAARIFTGAQIPPGADAVVMQEYCEAVASTGADDAFGGVRVNELPTPGVAIRRQGEDVMRGHVVLRAGHRLDAAAIGLAATVGMAQLEVAARPRVALFSTGDELVMPGEPLPPGAIYNSNRFMLGALLRGQGCDVTDLGNVPDRLEATRAMLREAAAGHDLILSSGGVSVGEEDHLKPALSAEGRLDLWAIAIKPGKPLAFGAVRHDPAAAALGHSGARPPQPLGSDSQAGGDVAVPETWFIGLPGNPVSSHVTFTLFVRPVLARLQGAQAQMPRPIPMRADFDWPRPDKRREFLRVRRNETGGLDLYANQGSGVLTSLAWGDGLADIPPGQAVRRGDLVRYLSLAELAP
ncbi:molybdopterin molybdotransferase MoeA [Scleromatobacter humisilvae]|uniref:Molybdopterin molybdenumtransferase n=1 Tax=Scleromatobacter humisilvae TaxID=2897159 RepID=A0A9X1YII0_9BURK|nr:molybdopterin molybdotransferase MoeA [Scleromatobacter humisilvae]MCK9686040.1 molybdopterin molybdotransferase MoeA [Scleromatobacter humisilvae]